MYPLVGLVVILGLWSLWGYASSRVEMTPYRVVKSTQDYEIRDYPAHIVAQTTVQGSYQDALNQGFRIVAGYIFGGNTKKERIAMTAPVVEQSASESIAMTAPVMASIDGESHVVAFGMPSSYTLDTLPTPTDSRVKLVTIPEKKMAVVRFSWWRTSDRIASKKQELLAALARDGVTVRGEPQYAGYNAPWTPPWMMRNEVLVEIE
jgi:effector-binding domain-containing protein